MKIKCTSRQSIRAFWQCLVFSFVVVLTTATQAQTVLNTTTVSGFSNNNGSGMALFNLQNTNPFPIEITQVESIVGTAGATVCDLWFRTTALNAATLPTSTVSVANGWTLAAQQSFTGIANTTTTNLTTQIMLTGISVMIPANSTYAICIAAYSGTSGRLRYHTLVSPNLPSTIVTAGGVNVLMGNGTTGSPLNVSFGVASAPPGGTFNVSRAFLGKITFNNLSGPCTNPPTAGTTTASPNIAGCTGSPVILNLSGNSTGLNQTYEWEGSLTGGGVGFSSVSAAQANPSLTINPSVTKYYRCKVVCSGGLPVYSTELQVGVLPGLAGGTYTINSTLPAGGTNFQSFTTAVAAMSCGISGPVVFNVGQGPAGGNFNEQIVIPFIPGSSPTNNVTFNGNGRTLYFGSTNSAARHVIQLNGAKYITINNLVIDASTGTYGWGIHFIGSADFNTISGCTINTDIENITSSNMHCVVMSNSNTSPTTVGANGNFNTLIGNTFIGGYYTVVLYGNSAAGGENLNNKVINNTFTDSYSYSLYMAYQKNDTISGNDFSRPARTASTTTAAVFLTTGNLNTLVEKNRVHNYFDQIPTNTSTCYTFYVAADGTAAAPNRYINNLVYNMNGSGTIYGIYNTGGDYLKAYHNTIAHNTTSATAGITYGFYQTTLATGIEYKNNIISITRGGSGEKVGLAFVTTTSTIVSNNNDIYVNSAGSGVQSIGTYGTTDYATLAAWQTANSGAYDAQSQSINPSFADPLAGNFKPYSFLLDNTGQALSVTTDILNAPRSATTPDVGAYEFTIPPIDIGVSALASPNSSGCYSASQSIVATVRNYGAAAINFTSFPANVICTVNGTVTATVSAPLTGILAPNATVNVTLTPAVNLSAAGAYAFKAYSVMASDPNPTNDSLQTFNTTVGVLAGSINSSHNSICVSETPTLTLAGAYGGNIQWQQSTVSTGGPWSNVGTNSTTYIPSTPVTVTTHYRAIVTCNASQAIATVLTITVNNPVLSGTTPGSRCGTGTVTLGASAPAGTTMNWYSAASGGAPLATGPTFTTPSISSTTNYYVAPSAGGFTANTGMLQTSGSGTSGAGVATYGNYFDVFQSFVLQSVVVYPVHATAGTAGTITIAILDPAGTVLMQSTANVIGYPLATPVPQTVTLNFTIPPGNNYRIVMFAKTIVTGLIFESSTAPPAPYPITLPGVLAITAGTFTNVIHPELYYYFYNWQVTTGCEGPRVAVPANVVPAPAINVTAADAAVCAGGSTTIAVSSSNPNYIYTWTSTPIGFTATGTGPHTVSPVVSTTYQVSAIDTSGLANDGCTISGSVSIVTGPVLAAGSISTITSTYCESGTPVLTLTGSTGGAIQWQQSTTSASGPWTNVGNGTASHTPAAPLNQTTYFRANTSCQSTTVNSNVLTVTINNPSLSSTTPGVRCGVGTVTLNATAASGDVNWYANATGGTALGTGNSFITPIISAPTTFYAAAKIGSGGIGFAEVGTGGTANIAGNTGNPYRTSAGGSLEIRTHMLILASELVAAGITSAADLTSLAFTTTGAAGTVINFTIKLGHTNTTVLTSTYETVPLTTVFTQATFSPAVGVNTHTFSVPFNWNGSSNLLVEVCQQQSVTGTTTISCNTPPAFANMGNAVAGGCTAVTGTTVANRPIMKFAYNGGCEGTRVAVLANVTPAPAISASTSNTTLCSGSSANLNVTSPNGGYTFTWMPGSLSGAAQTVTPTSSTLYTVIANDISGGPSDGCANAQTVQVNVQPTSVSLSASPAEICATGFSELSLTPSTGYAANSIQWQTSNDNVIFTNIPSATGTTYTTPTLTNTTKYYKAVIKDGLGAICYQPTVTVSASTPVVLSSTGATRCGTGPVTLQATGGGAGTIKWYTVPAGGTFIAGGNTYSPTVSASTTYYVEQSFGTTGGTPLVITEMDIGTNDQLEIMNVSGQTLDVTGWKVAISDSYTIITSVNTIVQVLSGTMAPGAIKTWTDLASGPNYWGNNMFWNPGAFPSFSGWAAILDQNNNLVDIVFNNWPAANINAASITVGSVTIVPSTKWSGDGVNITTVAATQSVSRQGGSDNNNANDFVIQNLSVGTLNPGMTTPFTGFGCVSARDAVPVIVNTAPAISASTTNADVCPGAASGLNVTSTNPGYSYTWNPGNLSGSSVTVNPHFQTIYTVSAHDGTAGAFAGCDITSTVTVSTKPKIFATASAVPNFVCSGDNSSLSAFANTTSQYLLSASTPTPVTVPGSGVTTLDNNVSVALGDLDDGAWLINLPFALSFFGEQYDQMYVGTNGYVSFLSGSAANAAPVLPAVANPNNTIYLAEYDWDYRTTGAIKYFVKGVAPNRSFVLHHENVPQFSGAGLLNGQIVIDEISGKITLMLISAGGSTVKTVGIENLGGTQAYAPASRNGVTWTLSTPESWEFDPAAIGGSFTYAWTPTTYLDDPTSSTPTAIGVINSTTYSVTVTSNLTGCSNFDTTSVVTGTPLVTSSSATLTTLCSGQNSTLEVIASGGCAPYLYTWDDGTNVLSSISELNAAPTQTTTYNYTVVDNAGNISVGSITVTVNPTPVITASPGLICGTGTATLTAASTVPGTTFAWTPSTNLNVTTGATVISSTTTTRTYTVTGTTAASCSSSTNVTVTVSPAISAATASATPSEVCLGGDVTLTASGLAATPGYVMNTNCSTPYIDISTIPGVPNVGVLGDDTEHNFNFPFSFNFNGTPYTFARVGTNGVIALGSTAGEVSLTNATLPSTANTAGNVLLVPYWDDLDIQMGANIYHTLVGSIYVIQFKDFAHNAFTTGAITFEVQIDTVTDNITFLYPDAVFGSVTYDLGVNATIGIQTSSTSANLFSFNQAALANGTCISFSSISLPVTYSWSGPNSFTSNVQSPVINNITAAGTGTYTATITSSAGCSGTATTNVTVGAPLVISAASSANNFCQGLSTILSSTASGGGQPYSYSWSDGTAVVGTTASFSIVPPAGTTTYTLTVTDNCGSVLTASAVVVVKPNPSVSAVKSGDICGTGSSTLTASGSGVTYAWTPTTNLSPTTGPTVVASPLGTTTYTVTSTGSNSCTNTATVTVNVNSLPAITASASPVNICSGGSSQLTADATNANQALLITDVLWNKVSPGQGVIPSFATAGADLTEISNITSSPINLTGFTIQSCTSNAATMSHSRVMPAGTIVPPFGTILICFGTGTDAPANNFYFTGGTNDEMQSGTVAGAGVVIKDPGGAIVDAFCYLNTGTFIWPAVSGVTSAHWTGTLNGTSGLAGAIRTANTDHNTPADWTVASASPTLTLAVFNTSVGYIPPSSGPFTFSWAPSTFLNNPNIANPLASGVTVSTTYVVTVTDVASNCSNTKPVSVLIQPLAAVPTISQATICAGTNDTLRASATGGSAPYSFSWSDGIATIGSGTELIVNPTVTTTYTLTASDGCGSTASNTVTVTVNPLPVMVVTPPGGAVCDGVPAAGIAMTASGATTYAWSPSQGLSATTGAAVTASGSANFATITYTVTGTITATGCVSSASVTVYRNTYLTNVASAVPAVICEDATSQLSSVFTIRTNPALLITEVTQFGGATTGQTSPRPAYFATGDDDFVEISNLSSSPINAGGLVFELWVGTLLNRSYTIPAGVMIAAKGVLVLHIGTGTDVPASNYYHTGGTNNPLGSTTAYGFILKSGASILDAVATTSSAGVTYSWPVGSTVTSAQWSGTVTYAASVAGAVRIGGYDNNTAADWVYASNTNRQTLGTYNNIYAGSSQPAFLYSWSPASFLDDATSSTPIVSNAIPGNYAYMVTATIPGSGCMKTASTNVTVYELPTATISGTADICVGASITLNFAFTGNAPYSYSFTDGTTTFGPYSSATATATRTITPAGSGSDVFTYTLVSVSDAHCTGTVSGSAMITFDQVDPTLTGCPTSFSMCNPITWTPPTANDNCAGVVRSSNWAPGATFPSGVTTVIYTATDANGNTTTCSFDVTLLEPSSVTGITLTSNKPFNNICTGDNVTVSMNGITGTSLGTGAHWKWYSGSCTAGVPVPGSTDQTSITVAPTVSTTYYVRAEGTCNTTPCVSLPVTVSTAPPSGNPGIAYYPVVAFAGATDSIMVNPVPGATFYNWSLSGNSNVLFNGQAPPYQSSTPKVTLTFISPATSGNGVGNYHIQFFAGNACGTTNSNNVRIRATVEAPTTVNGPLVACVGQTRSYTVSPVVGAKTYQWSFATGSGTITGNGTQTVNVTFTSLPAQLCVHGVTAFGSPGPDLCVDITTVTASPGAISGNVIPCQGGVEIYTIDPVVGAVSYTWTTTILGASISGTGTSATVNFPAGLFSGDVCVTAYSGCATSPSSCIPIVSGTVPPLGTITGIVEGVCGATSVNYQVPSTGATNYLWAVPAGANIVAGQGTNSILVDFDTTYAGGNITVLSTNSCGNANGSLAVTGAPPVPVFTVFTSSACVDDVFDYTASSPGATGYNWSVTGGNIITTGNPDNILVEWTSNGGTVSVTAENSCGNSAPAVLVVTSSCRLAGDKDLIETLNAEVFPNPSQGRMTLRYHSPEAAQYMLKVTDLTGRRLKQQSLSAVEGLNQFDIDLSHVAKGVYMLSLENNGASVVMRIVIE